jgi:hypothetical protein
LALKRQFAGPVAVVLAMDVLLMFMALHDNLMNREEQGMLILAFGSLVVVFVADFYSLAWVGQWLALTTATVNRASTGTMLRILVLPWVFFIVGLIGYARFGGYRVFKLEPAHAILFWLAISLAVDAVFAPVARVRLLTRFRVLASQPIRRSRV